MKHSKDFYGALLEYSYHWDTQFDLLMRAVRLTYTLDLIDQPTWVGIMKEIDRCQDLVLYGGT